MKNLSNIEYAALVIRLQDPGGTLPDDLRRYEQAVQNLVDKCNYLIDHIEGTDKPIHAGDYLREVKQALVELNEAA